MSDPEVREQLQALGQRVQDDKAVISQLMEANEALTEQLRLKTPTAFPSPSSTAGRSSSSPGAGRSIAVGEEYGVRDQVRKVVTSCGLEAEPVGTNAVVVAPVASDPTLTGILEVLKRQQVSNRETLTPVVSGQTTGGGRLGSEGCSSQQDRVYECLVGQSPVVEVLMGGVKVKCLIDTGSMVTTVTESFFRQHFFSQGCRGLTDCGWLALRAANGLTIPYLGYFEIDVQALGKTIQRRGVLVVKDPVGLMAVARKVAVPGLLGMNVIKECYELLIPRDGPTMVPVSMAQGDPVHPVEVVGGKAASVVFERVGPREEHVLLMEQHMTPGGSDEIHLKIAQLQFPGLTEEQIEQVRRVLGKYTHVFASSDGELGCTEVIQHEIPLTDCVPIKQRYRRIPPSQYEEVKAHIRQLLEQGAIRESCSPYSSPLVIVRKKDGSIRMCVDYRGLNAKTRKDAFPPPD
ncbi:hypothetical protein DPEC_G00375400 [Dallia pectoralis]|nr:hypothetical protein DPEC_G00375400 [Dallia pectoralis]